MRVSCVGSSDRETETETDGQTDGQTDRRTDILTDIQEETYVRTNTHQHTTHQHIIENTNTQRRSNSKRRRRQQHNITTTTQQHDTHITPHTALRCLCLGLPVCAPAQIATSTSIFCAALQNSLTMTTATLLTMYTEHLTVRMRAHIFSRAVLTVHA